jgi:hypothetical protein
MQANEGISNMRKKVGNFYFLLLIVQHNHFISFRFQILIGIHFDAI